MKTGATRQVQNRTQVLTVTVISTMVPVSADLPTTVRTENARIVRVSTLRRTGDVRRKRTAATGLIVRASTPTPRVAMAIRPVRMASVRNAPTEVLTVRALTTAKKESVRSARMAATVRDVRVSILTTRAATAIRPARMVSVRNVLMVTTTTASALNVRASSPTVAVTTMAASPTDVRSVRVRLTTTPTPSTARRSKSSIRSSSWIRTNLSA